MQTCRWRRCSQGWNCLNVFPSLTAPASMRRTSGVRIGRLSDPTEARQVSAGLSVVYGFSSVLNFPEEVPTRHWVHFSSSASILDQFLRHVSLIDRSQWLRQILKPRLSSSKKTLLGPARPQSEYLLSLARSERSRVLFHSAGVNVRMTWSISFSFSSFCHEVGASYFLVRRGVVSVTVSFATQFAEILNSVFRNMKPSQHLWP